MRWMRFSLGDTVSYGIVEGDSVAEVTGSPFERYERTGRKLLLTEVAVEVPVVPPTFYTAGVNYYDHVREAAEAAGKPFELPKTPDVNYRGPSALTAHGRPVIIPPDVDKVQYEGELVVVIGKKTKDVDEAEALSRVFGYTIGNDISQREWQARDRTLWRAKNADSFKPMGPWIETDVDLDAMTTHVRVNGREMVAFPTNRMLFGVARHISYMSRYVTLYPGDILWMGTDGTPQDMKAGDVVEVEISGIGTLRNPIVAGS